MDDFFVLFESQWKRMLNSFFVKIFSFTSMSTRVRWSNSCWFDSNKQAYV